MPVEKSATQLHFYVAQTISVNDGNGLLQISTLRAITGEDEIGAETARAVADSEVSESMKNNTCEMSIRGRYLPRIHVVPLECYKERLTWGSIIAT